MNYSFPRMGRLAAALAGLAILAAPMAASAQDYPDDTIHIVVPWRAGGGYDTVARALAKPLATIAGQSIVVDNITGGAGNAGMLAVKQSRPDGYTMLLNGSADITAPIVYRDVPYALSDYVCVGGVYQTPAWVIANSAKGFKSWGDYVEAARKAPGKMTLGVTDLATPDATLAEALVKKAGIDVRIIPFNGGAPLKKALLGSQVDAGVLIAPVMLEEVKNGDAVMLVSGGSLKNINYEPLQNAETPAAYGLDIEIGSTRGIFLPKDVPADVAAKAEELVGKAAQSAEFKEFGENFGFAPIWMPGKDFCAFMQQEDAIYRSIQ